MLFVQVIYQIFINSNLLMTPFNVRQYSLYRSYKFDNCSDNVNKSERHINERINSYYINYLNLLLTNEHIVQLEFVMMMLN